MSSLGGDRLLLGFRRRTALLEAASERVQALKQQPTQLPEKEQIAVVIPCLNEEKGVERAVLSALRYVNLHFRPVSIMQPLCDTAEAIASCRRIPEPIDALMHSEEGVEVVVVDGGSVDQSRAVCAELGVRVLEGKKLGCRCRADAMNMGAKATMAPLLVFLHADTVLPQGYGWVPQPYCGGTRPEGGLDHHLVRYVTIVWRCWGCGRAEVRGLQSRGAGVGAFRLAFGEEGTGPAPGLLLRFICWCANVRSDWLKLPYGDQALFMRCVGQVC